MDLRRARISGAKRIQAIRATIKPPDNASHDHRVQCMGSDSGSHAAQGRAANLQNGRFEEENGSLRGARNAPQGGETSYYSYRNEGPMAVSIMAGNPALKELSADLKRRMDQAVSGFQTNLASARTGRASVHMLDQIKVDYYGTPTPINQMAQVSAPEPQLILISPYDPTMLKEIEKAIQASDLGFNPISDGKVVRVPVPPMTEERRREVCKHINKVLEEHRTAVRNVRRDGNDALKKLAKDKKIGEDEEKRALEEVQKMTDDEIRRMEDLSRRKEAEVMQV